MKKIKSQFNRYLAMCMAILTLSSAVPIQIFATPSEPSNTITSIFIDGDEIILNEHGSFFIPETNGELEINQFTTVTPSNSTLGAEAVASQIQNTANILIDTTTMTSNEDGTYTAIIEGVIGDVTVSAGSEVIVTPLSTGIEIEIEANIAPWDYLALRYNYFGMDEFLEEQISLMDTSIVTEIDTLLSARSVSSPMPISRFIQTPYPVNPPSPGESIWANPVYIGGNRISAIRYSVTINGIIYEAFCIDPLRGGPDSPNFQGGWHVADRMPSNAVGNRITSVLHYGFPNNILYTSPEYDAYLTRVAVAYVSDGQGTGGGNITGDGHASYIANGARALAAGNPHVGFAPRHDIDVNGSRNATLQGSQQGDIYRAGPFTLGAFHDTQQGVTADNPVRFSQPHINGTPVAGARVVDANGNEISTTERIDSNITFYLEAPAGSISEGQTLTTDIRGVNYESAGAWVVLHGGRTGFGVPVAGEPQRLVFYIPRVYTVANMTITDTPPTIPPTIPPEIPPTTPPPTTPPNQTTTRVFIEKVDALSRENIPNATSTIQQNQPADWRFRQQHNQINQSGFWNPVQLGEPNALPRFDNLQQGINAPSIPMAAPVNTTPQSLSGGGAGFLPPTSVSN